MSDLTSREVEESPVPQGKNEQKSYVFNFTKTGGVPSSITTTLLDSKDTDLSTTNLSGSNTISGYYVTTKTVYNLKPGEVYRLFCKATVSGQIIEPYLVIHASR